MLISLLHVFMFTRVLMSGTGYMLCWYTLDSHVTLGITIAMLEGQMEHGTASMTLR